MVEMVRRAIVGGMWPWTGVRDREAGRLVRHQIMAIIKPAGRLIMVALTPRDHLRAVGVV